MKLKHLLTLATLIIGGGNLCAQTDVTSTYIDNPSFETDGSKTASNGALTGITGWTQSDPGNQYNNTGFYDASTNLPTQGTVSVTPSDGTYLLFFRRGWAQSTYTFTASSKANLPAGVYSLSVDYKMVEGYDDKQNNNTNVTIEAKSGGTSLGKATGTTKTNVKSGNAYSYLNTAAWSTVTANFTLDEEKEDVTFVISLKAGGQRRSDFVVDNVKLTCSPFATPSDYDALNSAISSVEGKTWGFDAGEYAPYNYVEVIEALATAKAIEQDANNSQTTVQALTTTLNTSMTANAAEVNAIWDPSFEHDYSGQTGNVQPIGWYRVKGTTGDGYNVRYASTGSFAGVAYTSSDHGLFTKLNAYYGWESGYTMPLNAETYYTVAFVAGGAGDCDDLTDNIDIINPSEETTRIKTYAVPNNTANSDATAASWISVSQIFKTGTAGNYVLGLVPRNSGNKSQNQFLYGDFVLKQTTIAEATAYYNTVLDEVDDSYIAEANGGSEKAAFKNAIDANVSGYTVAELMEAAANLPTLRDAFVAATPTYDALVAEIAIAKALGIEDATADGYAPTAESTTTTATAAIQALKVAEYNHVTTNYTVDGYDLFIGSWTVDNFDNLDDQHWSGETRTYYDKWSASSDVSSISKSEVTLPAGTYVFMAAGRGQADSESTATLQVVIGEDIYTASYTMKGDTGYGIDTDGATNFSAEGTYANNNAGRGWEWRYIKFTLNEETEVTLSIEGTVNNSWVSACDTRLLTTSDNVAVIKGLLNAEITTAEAIDKTTNVGTGAFQIPSSAVKDLNDAISAAQDVYDNPATTAAEATDAISTLQAAESTYANATLNGPTSGVQYRIKSTAADDAAWKDKYYWLKKDANQANGGYSTRAEKDDAEFWATAWKFTSVSGNTYKLSMIDADGNERYLCTNITGYGEGVATQIRTTTDADKALVVKVIAATGTDGRWFLQNTEDNSYLGGQDAGLYSNSQNYDLAIEAAEKASVNVDVNAGKCATRIFPFTPELPEGVTAWSCEEKEGIVLTLRPVAEPAANTPYILYSEEGFSGDALTGWGTASADSYEAGWLTGVYTRTEVPEDSYVLQTQDGKQGFYKVSQTGAYSSAYRAYVTVPESTDVKAFYGFKLSDIETAIEAAREAGESTVSLRYNVAGQKMDGARKGLNIVKMSDGSVRKVLVK